MLFPERQHLRREKVQAFLYEIAFYLELAAALLVIVLIVCQVVGLAFNMFSHPDALLENKSFMHYLELSLNIVIGIEFLKMLCRHNIDAVVEVLLFAMARHMLVAPTTILEDLLGIVAIAILFVVRKYLFVSQIDKIHYQNGPDKDSEESIH